MLIQRQQYLEQLIRKKNNGRVKIITGLRRSGKSFLLFELYANYLRENGVGEDQIIGLALDELPNAKYRNPMELDQAIRERIRDSKKQYYVMIDEIQFVSEIQNPYVDDPEAKLGFIDVVLGLVKIRNADIYVTGSNSRMLSSDILTQFRDRGDEIRVNPLSFSEFYAAYNGDKRHAWREYCTYGGMPLVLTLDSHEEKSKYLRDLFMNQL
ncbi:MAG: AAA family ATPase, partial [Lachnospiraceae bacterium]|nr:AAA family ATPase [Lachnospiraceae bacterium]